MTFQEMSRDELNSLLSSLKEEYAALQRKGLKLDMSRGNPSVDQLRMGADILGACTDVDSLISPDGIDCRNYGGAGGLLQLKELFGSIMGLPASNIYIGGVSSLNLMFDTVARAMLKGVAGSDGPWCTQGDVKFICPVPGYDRHMSILEYFGIGMIPVPLTGNGPDMDTVEKLVAEDPLIKGMWIVPVYSNPTGECYSEETLSRLAGMKTAAPDFTIFCDNAYPLHSLNGSFHEPIRLYDLCREAGNPDRALFFSSFSKVTFAGGSVCCIGGGDRSMELAKKWFSAQIITNDKINQLRHVRVLPDKQSVIERMKKHASIISPKFEMVERTFSKDLDGTGTAEWNCPEGGYFIALHVPQGCAKRTVSLCADAGVKLTSAGAGFPYGKDPLDSFIRIAPTYPSLEDLEQAAKLLCVCVKLAACEKLLESK